MVSNTSTVVILLKCLLLIACPVVITAADDCAENLKDEKYISEYRLPPKIIPVHYDIWLNLFVTGPKFSGEINITLEIKCVTQSINLHAHRLEITEQDTKLYNHRNRTIHRPTKHDYQKYRDSHVLVLHFSDTVVRGQYTLYFKYNGYFSEEDEGLIKLPDESLRSENTKWMVISQFGKTAARRVFPCWDEPALKATFNISVKHHLHHSAISTMPIQKEDHISRNLQVWSHFEKTPKMSTHLLGIVVIAASRCDFDDIFHMWCRQYTFVPDDFKQTVRQQYRTILSHMTNHTNISMTIPKLDIIIVPDYVLNNATIWGMLLMKQTWVIANIIDANEFNKIQKFNLTDFLAHEMTKQLFLPVVGLAWWSDLWLSNGLVLFYKAFILGKMYEERMMDFMAPSLQESLRLDDIRSQNNIEYYTKTETDFIESFIVVDKTLILLHMLKSLVTVSVFHNGVRIYLDRHQFGSATSDDFWDAMQSALDDTEYQYNFKIKEVMHNWLNQTTYSLVKVRRDYLRGNVFVRRVPRNDTKEASNSTWIPVTFVTNSSENCCNNTMWIRNDRMSVVSFIQARYDWIIVNKEQSGYYRVNYDATNWEQIGACLNSNEFTKIHVINRAQLIDDVYYFLVTKQLHYFTFLHITNYLQREVDYVPWISMFRIMSYLWKFFLLPFKDPQVIGGLQNQLHGIVDGLLKNIGYDDENHDDVITLLMRGTALKWACRFGDTLCLEKTRRKLDMRSSDDWAVLIGKRPIYSWEEWIYCSALKEADSVTWNKVWHIFERTHQYVILELLTCSETPKKIMDYFTLLSALVNQHKAQITDNQHSHIFGILVRKHAHKNEVLDYILQNFTDLKPRLYSKTTLLTDIILNVYSEEQLNKTYNFFKQDAEVSKNLPTRINTRLIYLHKLMTSFEEMFSLSRKSDILKWESDNLKKESELKGNNKSS